jgi:ribosomal protein S19
MRSSFKAPFVKNSVFAKLEKNKIPVFFRTKSRSTTIIPPMLGKIVGVHNGKFYFYIRITAAMLNTKLGAYVDTTQTGRMIHITKKNLKKKKRK